MVLTLFDICRVKVRDELEKGNFVRVHQLHPNLRQSVLNMVLMHGTINDPNCKEILGSQEFLDGMTSFDTQLGSVDDHKYLQRVATSLSGVSADGRTIGAKITELRLTLHGWSRFGIDDNKETGTGNLRSVVNVIAQCPKLEKLSFRTRDHQVEETFGLELLFGDESPSSDGEDVDETMVNLFASALNDGIGLLNDLDLLRPILPVLENLREFSFNGDVDDDADLRMILQNGKPMVEFKRLTSLYLKGCELGSDGWLKLLFGVRDSLTDLCLKSVEFSGEWKDCCLLFSLPKLKSFDVDDVVDNFGDVVNSLKNSPLLENMRFRFDVGVFGSLVRNRWLVDLAQLRAKMDVEIALIGNDVVNDSSEFRYISFFRENVDSFNYCTFRWDKRIIAATKHLVQTCHNLTALEYGMGMKQDNQTCREVKQAKWALFPLFSDKIRAAQLRSLHLFGDYDRKILAAVVSNCVNVSDFVIRKCPQLSNEHLIEWARRGVALSKLSIKDCNGVTDDGLVPLLISSGSKLIEFSVSLPNITERTYRTCIEHCRYLKDFDDDGIPRFKDLAAAKLFWKQDFI